MQRIQDPLSPRCELGDHWRHHKFLEGAIVLKSREGRLPSLTLLLSSPSSSHPDVFGEGHELGEGCLDAGSLGVVRWREPAAGFVRWKGELEMVGGRDPLGMGWYRIK